MTRTSLLTVAAGIVLAATPALAQQGGHGARPGVSWRGGGAVGHAGGNMQVRHHGGGNMQVRHHGGNMQVRHHGGNVQVRHRGGGNVVVRHNRGGNFNFRHHRGFRPGHGFQRRLHRGFTIHPFWFGPQFHINNWQMYGFADPGADQRWVRYYDDAYLVDRGGRVVDTRYGLDWDQYGERWAEEDGIPAYYGSRDWQPGDEDYAWADEQGRPDRDEEVDYAEHGGDEDGPPPPGYGHPGPMPHPGYGQGGAYGAGGYGGGAYGYGAYGYGWAYPIVIETTVTTGGGYTEEIVEEVVETRRRAHRPRRARPACACPAPVRRAPPPAGERG